MTAPAPAPGPGRAPAPSSAQLAAIESPLGPVLVVAGPGAGKTYCLIQRVRRLVRDLRFAPREICAVTFTNKAAEEIATRLQETLGHAAGDVTRGTLHTLCVGVLRQQASAVGLQPGFGIADEPYQLAVLGSLGVWGKRRRGVLIRFGRHRLAGYPLQSDEERLFRRYLTRLRERNMVDFDDLIVLTADLFARRPAAAADVAGRWRYVLVDEFQDLDPAQYEIVRHLAPHRNLFVVGDEEQSIFSWRGADPAVLRRFKDEFAATPIILDRNRRCSHQIFQTARRLLEHAPGLFDKQLRAERSSRHEVLAVAFDDEATETEWIVEDLRADREEHARSWGDYAILYRKHESGHGLERALVQAGIPCRLAQRRSLQDDPVIGQLVASIRLMARPRDPDALEAFGERVLPDQLRQRIHSEVRRSGLGFLAAVRTIAVTSPRGEPDAKRAWRLLRHVENLSALAASRATLGAVVRQILAQRVGRYRNILEEHHEDLTDPAGVPEVRRLAAQLRATAAADGRVWLEPSGGAEIAVRGMLSGAGFTTAAYLTAGAQPEIGDLVLGATSGQAVDPLTVFKALQLLQSRDFAPAFTDYVAFDLETTDRDPARCDIVELGAVRVRGGDIVDRFHSLVRPGVPVSAAAHAVHGYGDDDLRDAPRLTEVWPAFHAFVGRDVLVAHNGQRFDVPVLRRLAAGLEGTDQLVFYDTLPLARSLSKDSAKLEDLAIRFGVRIGRAHHALDDAEALARVFALLSGRALVRARKAVLTNVLDYLGLGLALAGCATAEAKLFLELARPYTLGRFTDCLEIYARECGLVPEAPAPGEVISRLGGAKLLARFQADFDPARRYPAAFARLEALIAASEGPTLAESMHRFLERVALSTSDGADVDPHRVSLLTLHATKGLEFPCVYVIGVEDAQLPGLRELADGQTAQIDEARRLLYVGMTRAMDRLVLTRAARRAGQDSGGSRFLDEMGVVAARSDRLRSAAPVARTAAPISFESPGTVP